MDARLDDARGADYVVLAAREKQIPRCARDDGRRVIGTVRAKADGDAGVIGLCEQKPTEALGDWSVRGKASGRGAAGLAIWRVRQILEVVGGAPVGWRKGDVPEIWGGGFELDGGVKTFGHGLGAADNLAGHAIFGSGVFQHQMGLNRETLFQDEQGSVVADADGSGVKGHRLSVQREMNIGAHAEKDALAATAFVAGDGCGGNRLRRRKWLGRSERF